MKNISKLLVGILFSALVMAPSYAGEMTVTGGATATYSIGGDTQGSGKTLGISNELDFTASGELDNGYTWKYQVQLDGASAANDDTRLEIGTDMGTVGFYISEGGMRKSLHGVGALGSGFDYHSPASGTSGAFQTGYNVDGYANVQYHTPADMLPFGLKIGLGYVPDMNDTTMLSAKDANSNPASHATGRNLTQVNFSMSPIDGLTLQGDAANTSNETGSSGPNGTEEGVSANLGAKYTMGSVSVGYVEGGYQPAVGSGELKYYENRFYGIQFDVNDALSISYNVDESESNARVAVAGGATQGTVTEVEMEQKTFQIAYTAGGATIGVAQAEVDNSDYTAGKEEGQTIVSLAIAF